MNLLNYLWETGIKPIKNAIAEKLDSSKAANNLLTTEEGFWLDARQGPVIQGQIDDINSNLSELSGSLSVDVISSDTNLIGSGGAINNNTVTIAKITGLKKGKYLVIASSLIQSVSSANIHQRLFLNSILTNGQTSATVPTNGWLKNPVIAFLDMTDNSIVEYKMQAQNSSVNVYDVFIIAIKLRT